MVNIITLTNGPTKQRWNIPEATYERYVDGTRVEQRPFDADDAAWQFVIQALEAMESGDAFAKLRNALNTNRTYLEKVNAGTATNADHLAQVSALTRQMVTVLLRTTLNTQ